MAIVKYVPFTVSPLKYDTNEQKVYKLALILKN